MSRADTSEDQSASAREHLSDLMYECLLRAGQPMRASEIAEAVSRTAPVSARVVAQTLERDPDFVSSNWAWDLACRHEIQDQPIGGAIRGCLHEYGKPLSMKELCALLGAGRDEPPALFAVVVKQASDGPDLVEVEPGLYGLREWMLSGTDADEATVRFINGLEGCEELEAAVARLGRKRLRRTRAAATAVAILEALGTPLPHKVLAFLVWQRHPRANVGADLFGALLKRDDAVLLRGPRWCAAPVIDSLVARLAELSADEDRARGVEPDFDVAKVLREKPRSRKRFALPPDAVAEASAAVASAGIVRVDHLVADLLGLYPGDDSFAAAVRALARELDEVDEVVSIGFGKYCSPGFVPVGVRQVPAVLAPTDAQGADAALPDRDLPPALRKLIHDPEREDVGEEGDVSLPARRKKRTEATYVVPYHHLQAGTLKVRRVDHDLFPAQPELVQMRFEYQGDGFDVWLNNATALLFGLGAWYSQYVPGPGALIRISTTEAAGTYELHYDGETDEHAYIEQARVARLRRLHAEAEKSDLSTLEIMQAIAQEHPSGVHFYTLVAEMNVVRRTSKRVIASHLCSSPHFAPVSGRPGVY
ncbi:MAG: hypothetical protein ACE5O2_09995, partial [Armatimonadota bacterium]